MSLNIAKDSKKRVVIVGGGFGGLKLANKLKKSGFQVVLIDKNNYHQFPPLIYQWPRQVWNRLPFPSLSARYSSIGKIFISVWRKYVLFSPKRT